MIRRTIQQTLLSLLFFWATSFLVYASDVPKDSIDLEPCSMQNNVFQGGERAVYDLYYKMGFMWISVGTVTFNVEETEEDFMVSAVGTTSSGYDWVFKIDDTFESHISKETLLPHTAIRDLEEGKYVLWDKVDFDQEAKVAQYHRGKTADSTTMKEFDLEGCMHDVLSIVYYTRNIDFNQFEKGDSFPVSVWLDKHTYNLDVMYEGEQENVKVKGLGRFNVIKFSPQLVGGEVFEEDGAMEIYASDDENKLPLMINSPLKVGSVRAVLTEYKGLKYEMDAQVK